MLLIFSPLFYTIVSLIRFLKIQTKQMATLVGFQGYHWYQEGPSSQITYHEECKPSPCTADLRIVSQSLSPVYVNGNTSHTGRRSAPTFTQLSFLQISQINRRNYFSWLSTHISLGRGENKQLIFPYLSLFVPCLFERRLSGYLWQPVGSN